MSTEIVKDGKVIHRSRNLRGILEYARRILIDSVTIKPVFSSDAPFVHSKASAILFVRWIDGATCETDFASFTICVDWCKDRSKFSRWPHKWPKHNVISSFDKFD